MEVSVYSGIHLIFNTINQMLNSKNLPGDDSGVVNGELLELNGKLLELESTRRM